MNLAFVLLFGVICIFGAILFNVIYNVCTKTRVIPFKSKAFILFFKLLGGLNSIFFLLIIADEDLK